MPETSNNINNLTIFQNEIFNDDFHFIDHFPLLDSDQYKFLKSTPIIKEVYYVLNYLNIHSKISLNHNGEFNPEFIRQIYFDLYKKMITIVPTNESELWPIIRLKYLLLDLKLIRFQGNICIITDKGHQYQHICLLKNLYQELFDYCANVWNWSFLESIENLEIIQDSLAILLYQTFQKAKVWKSETSLAIDSYKKMSELHKHLEFNIHDFIQSYCNGFLENFAIHMGLLEKRVIYGKYGNTNEFKISELFKKSYFLNVS